MELFERSEKLQSVLCENGYRKYAVSVSESEKQEFNTEDGSFVLYRTVYNNTASLRLFLDGRMGYIAGNDLTDEGLEKLVDDAAKTAQSAEPDDCQDIAPDQGKKTFESGCLTPDMDLLYSRVKELQTSIAAEYPLIRVGQVVAAHTREHSLYANTNGTQAEEFSGYYELTVEFAGNDGENTTSLDYLFLKLDRLDTPLLELGSFRTQLENAQASLHAKALSGKFEGTVIFTPGCLGSFLYMTIDNFASDTVIMNGTSPWLDKVGEKVADERVTVSLAPHDPRIVAGDCLTERGFFSEDVTIIEDGVLKCHKLSLYAANKTGRPVMKNSGFAGVMKPGDTKLADLIASVKKGIIIGYFSGGQPGVNGEFSGVAKNSFLIEDGKITGAVTETMINGNLADVLMNVRGISSEVLADGESVLPWMAADGIVISGK